MSELESDLRFLKLPQEFIWDVKQSNLLFNFDSLSVNVPTPPTHRMPSCHFFLFYSLIFCHFVLNVCDWIYLLFYMCLGSKAEYVKVWSLFTFWNTAEQWQDFTVGFISKAESVSWRAAPHTTESGDISCCFSCTAIMNTGVSALLFLKAECSFCFLIGVWAL